VTKDELDEVFALDVVLVESVWSVVNLSDLTANNSVFRLQKTSPSSSSYPMCACVCAGNTSGLGLTLNLNIEGRCLHAQLLQLERHVVLHLKVQFYLVSYDVEE
jgi:hypothetical protein